MRKLLFLSLAFVFVLSVSAIIAFEPININEASAADLAKLPGLSRPNANRIVEYREENGPFKSIDDLKKITHVTRSGNETPSFATARGVWRAGIKRLVDANIITVEGGTSEVDLVAVFKELYPDPVDLNTVTIKELIALQGISRPNATRIAQYRKANKGFKNVDDLKKITHLTRAGNESITFATARGVWRAGIRPLVEAGILVVEAKYDPSIDEDVALPDDDDDDDDEE